MKSPVDDTAGAVPEPIAVTGIGCRFPGGVRDLDTLGELLSRGADVIREVPADRWGPEFHDPRAAGAGTARSHVGAFLDDIDRFDAEYFGISPREAAALDPQQRVLLEVAWEAMSDAGRSRADWRGSRTAVFVGMLAGDYATLHAKTTGTAGIGPHYATGTEFSFAAGRLAYVFDLHGPAATLSSACSSSLLAVHVAAHSLRARDCDAALAGGVSLLLTPELSIFMSRIGAASPSGRCRPFDAAADGVVRGEGCGVVVLRRLADARADGDRVYAIIVGSAVNNDGGGLGLTTPNGSAQASVARAALAQAGLTPGDIDYVEAHGTGTPLGDQIELTTLAEVYGAARPPGSPLLIGSHKAVLGHTDAAAGMAGLLKAIWVARTRYAPAQPRLTSIIPVLDRDNAGIAIPTAGMSIEGRGRPVRAAVSAFGLSGTNAHVIVTAPGDAARTPRPPAGAFGETGPLLLVLSAPRSAQLAEQAAMMRVALSQAVAAGPAAVTDLVASAATRRTHERHRCAIAAEDPAGLLDRLARFGTAAGSVIAGDADPDHEPEPVFVYSGQGCQWPGMATSLYRAVPLIRDALDEYDALIREHAPWSLIDELRRGEGSRLGDTDIAQPAIFAVQCALSRWLMAHGVRPAALLGHSVGEIAAAHVAGCLTASQAARLVVLRGQLLHETADAGRMVAVDASPGDVRQMLDQAGLPVVIAAVNGPASVVLAGPADSVMAMTAELSGRGLRCVPLGVNYAFHSPVVADCGPRLKALLAGLHPAPPTLRLLSSAEPTVDIARPDAEYWAKNLTDPVLLWPAIQRLLTDLSPALIEVGPHPVLGRPLSDAIRACRRTGPVVGLLRRGDDGPLALLSALARLYVSRVSIDWEQVTGRPRQYRTVPVPCWGGERYWLPGVRRGQQCAQTVPGAPSLQPAGQIRTDTEEPAGHATADPDQAADRRAEVGDRVGAITRHVLGLGADQPLPGRRGLFEQGLTSVTALELRAMLETEFAVTLPTTIAFEHPTVDELSGYIAGLLAVTGPPAPAGASSQNAMRPEPVRPPLTAQALAAADPDRDHGPGWAIAVIGVACRLPGAASADGYWALLADGRDATGPLPPDRRSDPVWTEVDQGVPTHGGYLADVAGFDAPFFRISPREARSLDPQQRLLLEVAWEALEDAGLPTRVTADTDTGVYIGLNTADYQQLLTRELSGIDLYYGTGTSFAAAAGRLSYFLGLHGPSMAVDTACSASLTAVHLACQGLHDGDCQLAVVGGANVIVAPTVSASMSAGGALAPDGRCKSFGADADGYGRGEGAVALVLKPLAAARRDHDLIYAVIRGSAVNQDGASGGLTVPSPAAQAAVIRRALSRCGWAPDDVDYVEAHGTGTPLGDPLEVRALAEALGPGRAPGAPVLLGSVKANIGHLEAAAGLAGLLKIILALHHGEIPPHRIGRPSSMIDWSQLPVRLVTAKQAWPDRGRPARAGVSAFGFSGSNAHVLAEQAPAPSAPTIMQPELPHVLVITAATESALRAAAGRMADRIESAPDSELAAVIYTAAHRRTWLDHRAAVTGSTAAELATALSAVSAGQQHPRARLGSATDEAPGLFTDECAAAVRHGERCGLQPMKLPAYPWERRRYWYRDDRSAEIGTAARGDGQWFTIGWVPAQPPAERPGPPASWGVIGDGALADNVVTALEKRGHTVARLTPAAAPGLPDREWAAAWRRSLAALAASYPACTGVVLVGCPRTVLTASAHPLAGLPGAIALGQAMAGLPRAPGRLWFVTSRACDPERAGEVSLPDSALWETGRVLAMELPGRWGGLIDTDDDADAVVRALHAEDADDQVCVRAGRWYAARLCQAEPPEPRRRQVAGDRWHVVLGGSAAGPAVGALLACGARRVLLAGDIHAPSPLQPAGAVTWRRCAPGELDRTLCGLGPLGDVVAVSTPGVTTGVADVAEHDVRGRLDEAAELARLLAVSCHHAPQRITVIASAASSWGSVNSAAGAAAAGWLAGWARRAGPVTSLVGLMPRADTGELSPPHATLFEQSGLRLLSAADTEDLLREALLSDPAERSAAAVDLRRYVRLCQDLAPRTFLSGLAEVGQPTEGELRGRLLAMPAGSVADELVRHVSELVAAALGMTGDELDPERGFFDLGMDSVMAVTVRTHLEDDLGIELPSTLTFEHPSCLQLAGHLHGLLRPPAEAESGQSPDIAAEQPTPTAVSPGTGALLAELADEIAAAQSALAAGPAGRDQPRET